jgi:HPt (histidine-containing phosphotransfer) domain-containing protein
MESNYKQALINLKTDYEGALERFVGNDALYQKFLIKFLDDKNFSGLKMSIQQNDISAAFQYAHTLKGVVGNLGLNLLYTTTHPIVELLRQNQIEGTKELMIILERDYEKICNTIRSSIKE